ncbi:MAG: O-antigen ligase family protein [Proteobacteria bacterium]|nr:O-antigen ligase family protein [Pseudomonadota bacterium]
MTSSPAIPSYVTAQPGKALNLWLSFYIAILIGKFGEWIPGLSVVPLAKIAFLLTVILALRARQSLPGVVVRKLPAARSPIFFLSLALVSILFSVYKGQSVNMSYGVAISLASIVILLKVTQTLADLERLFYSLSVAAAGLALATIFSYGGGRAQLNGNFDPNDLAYGLVSILPITRTLAVLAIRRRMILNGLAIATIAAALLTGSRGAVIALGAELLLVLALPLGFAKDGTLKRFHLFRFVGSALVAAALGAALWGFLPMEIRERVATLVNLQDDYNMSSSKDGRSEIWSRDIAAVWDRPIGYGLGTSEYVNGITGGHYRAPHNSFIQSFVELGVIGVVLFALSYLVAFAQLGKVLRRGALPLEAGPCRAALYARALRVSIIANLVAGFFLSHAYDALLWILIAICAALVRIEGPKPAPVPAAAVS